MKPTLKQSIAIAAMADLFYDFLPGSGSSQWKGHVNFKTIAEKIGVGDFYQAGSKKSMIISLLEKTFTFRRGYFETLILEVVRSGFTYRQNKGKPIQPQEIDKLNGLLLELSVKISELWDSDFKKTLGQGVEVRVKEYVERILAQEKRKENEKKQRRIELDKLRSDFYAMYGNSNRQQVGIDFEKLLNKMFKIHNLSPRQPFRVVGEQIDGSFELDHEIYLLEAKWEKDPCPEADLLVFRGKIEGKSAYTRGVFISVNGVTLEATHAITKGKQPNFFVINGNDITVLLGDSVDLAEFFRKRQRILAEEGRIIVPFNELGC